MASGRMLSEQFYGRLIFKCASVTMFSLIMFGLRVCTKNNQPFHSFFSSQEFESMATL